MKLTHLLIAVAVALTFGVGGTTLATLTATTAHALSDDPSSTRPKCRRGFVWDKKQRRCVAAKQDSQLDIDSIYEAGRTLAHAGRGCGFKRPASSLISLVSAICLAPAR